MSKKLCPFCCCQFFKVQWLTVQYTYFPLWQDNLAVWVVVQICAPFVSLSLLSNLLNPSVSRKPDASYWDVFKVWNKNFETTFLNCLFKLYNYQSDLCENQFYRIFILWKHFNTFPILNDVHDVSWSRARQKWFEKLLFSFCM